MDKNYILQSNSGFKLYEKNRDLPIFDYHCHLSPKEIYEDREFSDIGEMFLGGDHYKWRLMRCFGIDEEFITGSAPMREKFRKYAAALETAASNPLYYWTKMELSIYFGIDEPLNPDTADEIYDKANEKIKKEHISPRKLIEGSNVRYIATTDDICDDLSWHEKLKNEALSFTVAPSFRTDRILSINKPGTKQMMDGLSEVSGINVTDLESFKSALCSRMDYFKEHGCRFSDVGLPFFPDRIYSSTEADAVFCKALSDGTITEEEYSGFLGHIYRFLGGEYKKRDMVMQMHLGVWRNANTKLFERCGADAGGDCMGEDITPSQLIRLLDSMNMDDALPITVLYALKPGLYPILCNVASSYKGCITGTAWWFCDNKRGIEEQIKTLCEQGHIGKFLGMLTDSRSFLSYARHDFFRRIFCNVIGELCDKGEFDEKAAEKLTEAVFCGNISTLIEKGVL